MVEWQKIKADYISGNTSYRKLAEKYNVSFNTLKDRAVAEQWYQLRQQNHNRITTKIIKANGDKDVKKAVDIVSVADKLLDKIGELADKVVVDTQSLKQLTSALKDLKEIKGYKSAKDLEEQEARINKLRKEAEREDDATNEIEIVFNAGEEAWNE